MLPSPMTGISVSRCRSSAETACSIRASECRRVTTTECQFADDSSLFAKTYGGAERALALFREVAASFGLSVNLGKIKFMPMGVGVVASDMLPFGRTVDTWTAFVILAARSLLMLEVALMSLAGSLQLRVHLAP